jgi:dTMP kinase
VTPRFIAFEGGDAAGKSTQADRLVGRIGAVQTREPGGTPAGEAIRALFLDPATGDLDPRTEALLMAAARAQHAATVIRPALEAGRHVVTDRYLYSSVAYQAHARGLDPDDVRTLSLWATADLEPDAVVLLDVPVDVARARVAGSAPDRVESEDAGFHERVRDGYLTQAEADPERWVVVDATGGPDEVWEQVWGRLVERLPDLGAMMGR